MPSSGVQDKHIKKIIYLNLAVHLVIMDMRRCALMKLSHSGLRLANCKSSPSNNDQVNHSGLKKS
jgi:hypothetical protein